MKERVRIQFKIGKKSHHYRQHGHRMAVTIDSMGIEEPSPQTAWVCKGLKKIV